MKKPLALALVLLLGLSMVMAANAQKIHSVDSDVYQAITNLYIASGKALPSTGGPWSSDELAKMLAKIDRSELEEGSQAAYDFVAAELNEAHRAVSFGLDVALEGYYHTDAVNFTDEADWVRGYDERNPLMDIVLETWPSEHFYGYSSFYVGGTKYNDYSAAKGPVSYSFGAAPFSTNIFFTPAPADIQDLDFGMPYRASGSVGGDGWSVQVGRDKLSWGPGVTGNFMLGDHLKYHNVGRVTAYGDTFKYTFATSFFPHPSQYYPVIDGSGNFVNIRGQGQLSQGLNMFMAHRLEWRMLADKVGLALSEAVMYQSLDNTLDLRVLNPAAIFHNYYIRSNGNSLLTVEADYTPIAGVNVYGQVAVDEFSLPGVPVPGKDDNALPAAFGYMAGAKASYPMGSGMLYGSFEYAKTDPYLYLRDNGDYVQSLGEYGINWVVAIREYYAHAILYDEQFLGYEYGPDAIVINANAGYKQYGKWSVEGNLFYMLHGTHDKWTLWSYVDNGDGIGDDDPVYQPTPTSSHETENNGDLNEEARDAVSKTLVVGVKGNYTILPGLNVFAQADFINIANPGNVSANAPVSDIQLSFGVSYSL